MNYSKQYGTAQVKPKTCKNCPNICSGRGSTGLCRSCSAATTNHHRSTGRDYVKTEHEETHIRENFLFKQYAASIEKALSGSGWLNIRQIHERIEVNRAWTMDALDYLNVERDETRIISVYRLK